MAKKTKPAKSAPFDRVVYQIEESRAGAVYEATCPELVITAFGDTAEDAKVLLRRQVSEYLEDCEKLEILEETLIEAGFYHNGEVWMSNEVEPVPDPKIRYFGTPSEQIPGLPVD
ncbi:MAG: hypothetical protein J4N87_04030 [Chloroflexi bacterium]|nr:hypothetical protein [Chloroflexota bacterium]